MTFKHIIALEKFETGVTVHVAFDMVRVCWLAVRNDDRLQGETIPFMFNAGGKHHPAAATSRLDAITIRVFYCSSSRGAMALSIQYSLLVVSHFIAGSLSKAAMACCAG